MIVWKLYDQNVKVNIKIKNSQIQNTWHYPTRVTIQRETRSYILYPNVLRGVRLHLWRAQNLQLFALKKFFFLSWSEKKLWTILYTFFGSYFFDFFQLFLLWHVPFFTFFFNFYQTFTIHLIKHFISCFTFHFCWNLHKCFKKLVLLSQTPNFANCTRIRSQILLVRCLTKPLTSNCPKNSCSLTVAAKF